MTTRYFGYAIIGWRLVNCEWVFGTIDDAESVFLETYLIRSESVSEKWAENILMIRFFHSVRGLSESSKQNKFEAR